MFFLAVRHARKGALDDERREVLARRVDHLAEDDVDVGEAAVRDPHLLAVQHEAAVGLASPRASCAPSASDPDPGSLRQ